MYNKVEICGVSTAKLPVLSEERKTELLIQIKKGDRLAREEMISGNLKLVLSVIQSFARRGENPDDLFQVGCIGLIKAVDNFCMDKEVRFSTYAVPMILGEIRRFLRDNNTVRISRSVRDLAYKALQAKERISGEKGREATIDEIAASLEADKKDVINALDAIVEPLSLYEPVNGDESDSLYLFDQIRDTENTDENWLTDMALTGAIKHLGERERRILLMRFYKGKTQTEVACEIGISQAQVSRLEKNALESIKKQL
ncbi:MAG TPA: RNA polymerase sporulation sigma factor SigG [Bacillota bacterium]|nr:RNA polymerase sporulation sigma factor SigG [Bacillota bacterium]